MNSEFNDPFDLKLNVPLRGLPAGTTIRFSRENKKLDTYWIKRIQDSAIDHCVTILSKAVKPKEVESKEKRPIKSTEKADKSKNSSKKLRKDYGD